MNVKLTRQQELALIEIGLRTLLRSAIEPTPDGDVPKRKYKKRGKKWSAAQKAKFSATMKKKWADRRKATDSK